jgi:hypothetical protein
MDQVIKEKWVKALRSGEFKQIQNRLGCLNHGMCCLGVLTHIQGVDLTGYYESYDEYDGEYKDEWAYKEEPPTEYMAGITTDQSLILMDMNDEQRKSFVEIADYVEKKSLIRLTLTSSVTISGE